MQLRMYSTVTQNSFLAHCYRTSFGQLRPLLLKCHILTYLYWALSESTAYLFYFILIET